MRPAPDKVFSVFEEHTRRISKGKVERPVELGVSLGFYVGIKGIQS